MTIKEILNDKNMSVYKLSKESSVPYATCNDIVNGKTQLEKCSAETVFKIANALNVSMEALLMPCFELRSTFDNFKSTICHRLKELGDIPFIIDVLESNLIYRYYEKKWYPECLYLLAMLDYLCRENELPLCEEFEQIRRCKLEKKVYPLSIIAFSAVSDRDDYLLNVEANSIPEFSRFNIIENEVRNVI